MQTLGVGVLDGGRERVGRPHLHGRWWRPGHRHGRSGGVARSQHAHTQRGKQGLTTPGKAQSHRDPPAGTAARQPRRHAGDLLVARQLRYPPQGANGLECFVSPPSDGFALNSYSTSSRLTRVSETTPKFHIHKRQEYVELCLGVNTRARLSSMCAFGYMSALSDGALMRFATVKYDARMRARFLLWRALALARFLSALRSRSRACEISAYFPNENAFERRVEMLCSRFSSRFSKARNLG
jgi:hypothetical protein